MIKVAVVGPVFVISISLVVVWVLPPRRASQVCRSQVPTRLSMVGMVLSVVGVVGLVGVLGVVAAGVSVVVGVVSVLSSPAEDPVSHPLANSKARIMMLMTIRFFFLKIIFYRL